jgi:CheY-like chemotaxis protein
VTKILCVDDEPRVLEGIESHLAFDYDVSIATSGASGLEVMRADGPFAVVVSDMRMPEMNGAQFLAEVRRHWPDTTRLLLTGYSEIDAAISAINEGGVFRFLTKPCPPETLLAVVEEAVELNRLVTAERELLEGTVQGAVQLLTDVLAVVSPAAFDRTTELTRMTVDAGALLGLAGWELEVATRLARLGWIGLPGETLDRMLLGEPLTGEERSMVRKSGETAARLISRIPRLEPVAKLVGTAHAGAVPAADKHTKMANLIGAAMRVDMEVARGSGLADAVAKLEGSYSRELLDCLADVDLSVDPEEKWIQTELMADDLIAGMILDDNVFTSAGHLLIKTNTQLTAPLVLRIRAFAGGIGLEQPMAVRYRAGSLD